MKTLQITHVTKEYAIDSGYSSIDEFVEYENCYSANQKVDFSAFDECNIAEYDKQKSYVQNYVNYLDDGIIVFISFGPIVVPTTHEKTHFINVLQELV
jgi:hypothetical protein